MNKGNAEEGIEIREPFDRFDHRVSVYFTWEILFRLRQWNSKKKKEKPKGEEDIELPFLLEASSLPPASLAQLTSSQQHALQFFDFFHR
jgi:hypothetical protein